MSLATMIIIGAIAFVIAGFAVLGYMSRSGTAPGLRDGKLTSCPKRPNCVSSENPKDTKHFTAPLDFPGEDPAKIRIALRQVIEDMGGRIMTQQDNYIAAEFRSLIFGFIDDFEIRIDEENRQIHVRSGSRVGYKDRGVNRHRVDKFNGLFLSYQD